MRRAAPCRVSSPIDVPELAPFITRVFHWDDKTIETPRRSTRKVQNCILITNMLSNNRDT